MRSIPKYYKREYVISRNILGLAVAQKTMN